MRRSDRFKSRRAERPTYAEQFIRCSHQRFSLRFGNGRNARTFFDVRAFFIPQLIHSEDLMIKARGFCAHDASSALKLFDFEREPARSNEVEIEVMFCGVCHSDIHQVKNEWSNTVYPCMPGHEVVGRVTQVGEGVTRHAVGDVVGVGCMIDSCGDCDACQAGDQNYCEGPNSWLATYNGPMKPAAQSPDKTNIYGRDNTFGGYSDRLVVREDFVLKIPEALKPEHAAPILCAGVTTYSPMKHWGVKAGDKVGIIGFGGLGDMAARLAEAMGAEVTLFTTTPEKQEAAASLGAQCIHSEDEAALKKLASSFDFMLSTVPEKHDVNPFVELLKRDAALVIVGALEPLEPVNNMKVAMQRKSVAGSLIGNLAETQEVLDFCAEHGVHPDIELLPIGRINEAYGKVENGEVRFRYVIDMATLQDAA
jgi:alcohol dehydrogenase (NADP+)